MQFQYYAHKRPGLCARKIIKGTQLNLKKPCFIEPNYLAIKRQENLK